MVEKTRKRSFRIRWTATLLSNTLQLLPTDNCSNKMKTSTFVFYMLIADVNAIEVAVSCSTSVSNTHGNCILINNRAATMSFSYILGANESSGSLRLESDSPPTRVYNSNGVDEGDLLESLVGRAEANFSESEGNVTMTLTIKQYNSSIDNPEYHFVVVYAVNGHYETHKQPLEFDDTAIDLSSLQASGSDWELSNDYSPGDSSVTIKQSRPLVNNVLLPAVRVNATRQDNNKELPVNPVNGSDSAVTVDISSVPAGTLVKAFVINPATSAERATTFVIGRSNLVLSSFEALSGWAIAFIVLSLLIVAVRYGIAAVVLYRTVSKDKDVEKQEPLLGKYSGEEETSLSNTEKALTGEKGPLTDYVCGIKHQET